MRRYLAIFLLGLGLASDAVAEDARLKSLNNGVEAKAWEAVGRLDINGASFCTGALIAPKLVLTAAHCLFDRRTKERIDGSEVQFLAGWRNGRAGAYRDVKRAVIHPKYVYDGDVSSERVKHDLAILELTHPVRNTTIKPFRTAPRPRRGDQVGVVSYALERAEAPSLQEVCEVLARQDGVLVTSCSVDFGSSGAPIFVFRDGEPYIVSVVSAKAEAGGKPVSLGTALGQSFAELQAELVAGRGAFLQGAPGGVSVRVGEEKRDTGAKFVRP
nr:trypsin-like serine protease [Sulfitobacter sp. S190]